MVPSGERSVFGAQKGCQRTGRPLYFDIEVFVSQAFPFSSLHSICIASLGHSGIRRNSIEPLLHVCFWASLPSNIRATGETKKYTSGS